MTRSSIAADAVTTLKVVPGSYRSWTARLRRALSWHARYAFGVNGGCRALGGSSRLVGRTLPPSVRNRYLFPERLGEPLAFPRGAVAECRAQPRNGFVRVANFGRHGVDRVGVHARREHATLAVDDVAALR